MKFIILLSYVAAVALMCWASYEKGIKDDLVLVNKSLSQTEVVMGLMDHYKADRDSLQQIVDSSNRAKPLNNKSK